MPLARLVLLILAGVACPAAPSRHHQESFDLPAAADRFFSGTVTESSEDSISVTRSVLGKRPVVRRFIVNPGTTVEGTIRPKARVTVRYVSEEEGDRAVHIIVRERKETK